MVYKNTKKGAQGIGTLIIFIALILVAAVAAGVLISTVGNLQGKAETTGSEIQERLGTGVTVVEVLATNTSDGQIEGAEGDSILVTVQLAPGSDPIRLDDITLTLVTNNGIQSYSYADAPASVTTFNGSYIGTATLAGYISKGDVTTFEFLLPTTVTITEAERFTVRVFPGSGNPLPIQLVTPPSMTTTYTVLK